MERDWKSDRRFYSLEERLKHAVIPPKLYLRNLAARRLKKGERELHFLDRLVRPGCTAIDAGANKGLYSYLLSRIAAKVIAFEPNPKMFGILQRSVPDNVECHEIALSDSEGTAELILPIHRTGRFSNQGATLQAKKLDAGRDFETWPVNQATLGSFGLAAVGFIKIDVEGFELELLRGARETLSREQPVLQVEIDETQNKTPLNDAIAEICAYGYSCYSVVGEELLPWLGKDRPGASRPTDNLIFRPDG